MKKTILLFLLLVAGLFHSCKKYVQQQEHNALVDLITNGTWIVTRYVENGSDITPSFAGYIFQFQSNGNVTGTLGATVVSGTWAGDIDTRTITSDFPSAGNPVSKLNAVWTITDSYPDSVAAVTSIDSGINILNLHKQ